MSTRSWLAWALVSMGLTAIIGTGVGLTSKEWAYLAGIQVAVYGLVLYHTRPGK